MKIQINSQVKDESLVLEKTLLFWKEYPVDKFIFCNDHSSDTTEEVIKDILKDRALVHNLDTAQYEEGTNRSYLLEYSRKDGADIVISIDADEILSASFLDNFDRIMEVAIVKRLNVYQFNVGGAFRKLRQDPKYIGNFRDFLFPVKHSLPMNPSLNAFAMRGRHKTPRSPIINLPLVYLNPDKGGFIHLQAMNRRFYAFKQLYYKVFEYKEFGTAPSEINRNYDPVMNGLDFQEIDMPSHVIRDDWSFDPSVFDKLLEQRGYEEYVKKYGVEELFTFGKEYLK